MNEKMSHYWIELNCIWQIKSDSLVSYPKKIWTFWTHVGCLHQPTRNQLKLQFHCVTFAFVWLCSLTLNVDFVCLTLFVWLCLFDFVCLTLFVWFCLFDFVYLTLLYMTLLWLTLFIWLFVFIVWLFCPFLIFFPLLMSPAQEKPSVGIWFHHSCNIWC